MASREDVHRGEIVGDALVALFLGFTAERLSLVGSPVKISLPPLQSGGGQKRTGQEIMASLGIFALLYETSIHKNYTCTGVHRNTLLPCSAGDAPGNLRNALPLAPLSPFPTL